MADNFSTIIEESTRGSFFLITGNIIATVISAISVFIIARLLDPQLYGIYTISLTVPSLLLIFTSFGIDKALTHFLAHFSGKGENNNLEIIIRLGIIFRVITGIAIFVACYIFSDYLATYVISRPEYAAYIRLASIVISFKPFSIVQAQFSLV